MEFDLSWIDKAFSAIGRFVWNLFKLLLRGLFGRVNLAQRIVAWGILLFIVIFVLVNIKK